MSSQKKKTPAEELLDSLLNEVGDSDEVGSSEDAFRLDSDELKGDLKETAFAVSEGVVIDDDPDMHKEGRVHLDPTAVAAIDFGDFLRSKKDTKSFDKTEVRPSQDKAEFRFYQNNEYHSATEVSEFSNKEDSQYESTRVGVPIKQGYEEENLNTKFGELQLEPMEPNVVDLQALEAEENKQASNPEKIFENIQEDPAPALVFDMEPAASELPSSIPFGEDVKTQVILTSQSSVLSGASKLNQGDSQVGTVAVNGLSEPEGPIFEDVKPRLRRQVDEGTVAVTGFQIKPEENLEGKVKVSVGKPGRSSSFSSWGGSVDSNLSQAENLRMAQEKILELENENEKLRRQNEELISASEILKERSDLMTAQLTEYRNDREGLEQSFKNEMTLIKNHLTRKDAELKKAQFKVDELESRLKFDLKKIRVRERELENRLELVRAEKNAISKNKDEQILDLRRKMDIIQMEVDSYRQKCVELNKQIESSQDSFKRTTRALRLAMANLELQEENKAPLKKAE